MRRRRSKGRDRYDCRRLRRQSGVHNSPGLTPIRPGDPFKRDVQQDVIANRHFERNERERQRHVIARHILLQQRERPRIAGGVQRHDCPFDRLTRTVSPTVQVQRFGLYDSRAIFAISTPRGRLGARPTPRAGRRRKTLRTHAERRRRERQKRIGRRIPDTVPAAYRNFSSTVILQEAYRREADRSSRMRQYLLCSAAPRDAANVDAT